jgi:hypothetical protein
LNSQSLPKKQVTNQWNSFINETAEPTGLKAPPV